MDLIDSHCHLLGFARKGQLEDMLARAAAAGVSRMIAVGTSPEDWVPYREMHAANKGRIDYTVGLHPCYVEEGWEEAVGQISTFFIPPEPPVALGEIGLDYFHLPKDPVAAGEAMLMQEAAFRQQLLLAGELSQPVVVHSRNAFEDTFRMIDESGVDWNRVVFHCFSYGPDEAARINERGGRASFTGIATYKNAPEVQQALARQGIDRLMLETDSPYLSPESHRGKSNEPAFLEAIAEHAARLLGLPPEEVASRTTENTKRFFQIA